MNKLEDFNGCDVALIVGFEQEHELPLLTGTPKQIAWARDIRYRFLSQAFGSFVPNLSVELDQARNERVSKVWIEEYRHHCGDPNGGLMVRRRVNFAKAAKQNRTPKDVEQHAETIKTVHATKRWEKEHPGLVPLHGISKGQINAGRYSRYNILKNVPVPERYREGKAVSAVFWIMQWKLLADKGRLNRVDFRRIVSGIRDCRGSVASLANANATAWS